MEDTGLQNWPCVVSAVPLFLPPTSKVFHLLPNTLLPLVFRDYLLPLLFPFSCPHPEPLHHLTHPLASITPGSVLPAHLFFFILFILSPPCTPWPPLLLFLSFHPSFYSASTHTGLRLPSRFFCSFLLCPPFVFTSTEAVPSSPPIFRLPSLHFMTSYDKRTLDGTL